MKIEDQGSLNFCVAGTMVFWWAVKVVAVIALLVVFIWRHV